MTFSPHRWEAAYRHAARRAFRTVPFYREQWAAAGRPLRDPVPVEAGELRTQLFRLCPLARPHRPGREPSLWTGDPRDLRAALALAGALPAGLPVLEVRPALVDWTELGRGGPRYAPVLSPGAVVADPARRAALNARAVALAGATGAVLVGAPDELHAVLAELGVAARTVLRLRPGQPAPGHGPAVLHDPQLGYLGARVRSCGRFHLDHARYHARADPDGVLVTKLRQTRPTLVNVRPAGARTVTVRYCPDHHSPTLDAQAAARTDARTVARSGREPSST